MPLFRIEILGRSGMSLLGKSLKPTGADSGSLYQFIEAISHTTTFSLSYMAKDYPAPGEYKMSARSKLHELLHYNPRPVEMNAEVVNREDRGDYIQEKVYFNTAPWFRVPAFVLIPKKGLPPYPAIVDLHSHGVYYQFGKEKNVEMEREHPTLRDYKKLYYGGKSVGSELARRGYLVVTIDCFGFGERRLILDEDIKMGNKSREELSIYEVNYLNEKMAASEHQLAKSLFLAGASWSGIVIMDDLRTMDYLYTRCDVDTERIGCIGLSLGGTRSTFLAGLDERVKCAVIAGAMSTHTPMIKAHAKCHTWINYVPGMHNYFDFPDVAAIRAPLPLMVQYCAQDELFPEEGMNAATKKIQSIYQKIGAPGNFSARTFDVPHQFNAEMQEVAFAWLDKWLGKKS